MWFLLLYMQISAGQGFNVSLRGSASPCRGRLEVYDGKSQWGLVCHSGWKKENGEVVCRSIGCGGSEDSGVEMTLYKDPPLPSQYLMDKVNCASEENSLWMCPFVREENLRCKESSFVAVECSGSVTLSLSLNNQTSKCAGVVEFVTHNDIIGVCSSDWTPRVADKICQELGCGKHHYIPKPGVFRGRRSKRNVLFNCVGDEQYSWQCMEWSTYCPDRASVVCTQHRKFRLQNGFNLCSGLVEEFKVSSQSWKVLQQNDVSADVICTQMNCGTTGNFTNNTLHLTCAENVKLRNFTSKCFGDVFFVVNGVDRGVCYSDLDPTQQRNLGKVVCRELGCGEMLDVQEGGISDGALSNVECNGDEESLWHCLANHERKRCRTTKVICSDSLDVRLRDGLGECSGRVEVKWEDSWKSIRSSDWTTENSDVVCKHLGCGASTKMSKELFVDGKKSTLDSWKIKCQSSSAKIHKCFRKKTPSEPRDEKQQNIIKVICQEEELLFFGGDTPCKGRVRITSIDGSEPVGENKKNASDVCREMQCGSLDSFESNSTYASCSGSVSIELRNPDNREIVERCWGMVEVCRAGKCETVCRKTWTIEDATMICKNLGCGDPVWGQNIPMTKNPPVGIYSVYCPKEVQNISMCLFIPNKDSICQPAQVICADSIKAKLEDPRDKCAGKVSLFFAGRWTPVCYNGFTKDIGNVVCRELNCGDYNRSSLHDEATITGLSGINCQQDNNSVSQCDFRNIHLKQECYASYLACQGWKRLLLYKNKGECKGPVYMYAQHEALLVTGQGWGREERQNMCEYLQCGNYIEPSENNPSNYSITSWNKAYSCSWDQKMWECKGQDQPVEPQTQLHIECDGKPSVRLSDKCTGEVLVNNENVCASQWSHQMSHDLCNSLNCGSAIHHWSTPALVTGRWHFSCTGKEMLLWQCSPKKVRCGSIISVACERSLEFASTKKCGGKLGVKYRGQWEYVCGGLNLNENKEVCGVLNCNDTAMILLDENIEKEMKVTLKCPNKHYNISHCVQHLKDEPCTEKPAELNCYLQEPGDSAVKVMAGPIVGILGLLLLLFMWINRKRLLLALRKYRNKNGKDINADGDEMENTNRDNRDFLDENTSFLEHDDYEDVNSTINKSESKYLVPPTEEEDEDDRSKGSSGTEYDDIEGQANSSSNPQTFADDDLDLPVLPKRPENILADQDTYEVETEKMEDYDDAVPLEDSANEHLEKTETEAGVDVDEMADSDSGTGVNVDGVIVATEAEVHAPPKQ